MFRERINNERGVSIILVALSIIVLFGFGALAIDVAHIYNVKNQLQVAADAAALAGANELDGTTFRNQTSARSAAIRVALKNTADVGNAGPIPVTLQRNDNNAATAPPGDDIVVGFWNSSAQTFTAATNNSSTVNAVKVIAYRNSSAANTTQPRVQNWFAKIFKLLGASFDFSSVAATAVAAKESPSLLPVAVNEYWGSTPRNGQPYDTPSNPTAQNYPNSFVRRYRVPRPGVLPNLSTSTMWRNTFAILGADANPSTPDSGDDPNGYLDLDARADSYINVNANTYLVQTDTSNPNCSTSCTTLVPAHSITHGNAENEKFGTGLNYLQNGYPPTRLPPTAIYEYLINGYSNYPSKSNTVYGGSGPPPLNNDPSACPYAGVYYFSTGGFPPLNKYEPQVNSRFLALVYDGTHAAVPKFLTIVGYVVIEVDGYATGVPSFKTYAEDPTYATNKSLLGGSGPNTMFGHAISDIIQPDPTDPNGGCAFLPKLQQELKNFSFVHLVRFQPSLGRYGVANQ